MKSLVTPPLEGSILDGVTRDSVIALAQRLGGFASPSAASASMTSLASHGAGNLTEVFGTGTGRPSSPCL